MQGDLIQDLHFDPKSQASNQDVELIDFVFKSSLTATQESGGFVLQTKKTFLTGVFFALLSNHYCENFIYRYTPSAYVNLLVRTIIFLILVFILQKLL